MTLPKLWDIFCKVVDNFGDIGVCWRLAADLASRGHQVRLWVDDPAALAWMAPGACEGSWYGIRVMAWEQSRDTGVLAGLACADVWIEGFGCDIAPEFLAFCLGAMPGSGHCGTRAPVWINLEYLTAEPFAQRSHGLPSPVLAGPAKGYTRHFFYPGFSPRTGGLLREANLAQRQAGFDRGAWLASHGIRWQGQRLVSLFCYEPPALADLLALLEQDAQPSLLLVTHGRAARAVVNVQGLGGAQPGGAQARLSVQFLPRLAQTDFDHLLWACDLNFVRGEDSLVRAIWADRPFVWQTYPQHDNAHHTKLHAFLDAVGAPPSWRMFHLAWNGVGLQLVQAPDLESWRGAAQRATIQLAAQSDLTSKLLAFADKTRRDRDCDPQNS